MLYGRITGLVLSLFLPAFYRHVARNWGGIGLLYLILLFTLTWIPVLAYWQMRYNDTIQAEFPKIAPKFPNVTIKNGKVSSPVEQPLEVKDDNGNVVFILDTTGKFNSLDETPALFLLTETKFHQRDPNQNRIQIHDLAQFPDFEFTPEFVRSWLDFFGTWLAVGLFPFCMICSLIRAIVIMFIAAILGLIVDSAVGNRISFGGLLRMAAVGMTLSVYQGTALSFIDIVLPFPVPFLIAAGLTSMYVAFGVWAAGPLPAIKRERDEFDGEYDDDRRRDDGRTKRERGYDD